MSACSVTRVLALMDVAANEVDGKCHSAVVAGCSKGEAARDARHRVYTSSTLMICTLGLTDVFSGAASVATPQGKC